MRPFDVSKFWNFVSSFLSFLNDFSKNLTENFWHGLHIVGEHLYSRGTEFKDAQAPEYSDTDVYEDYYEIKVSPLLSVPLKLDPSIINPKQVIIPKSIIIVDPVYSNEAPIYSDLIEIKKDDYYTIRDIGIGCYVVIMVKKEGVSNRYFKIKNLKSSEEDAGPRYYNPNSANDLKYIIELENADLSYIGINSFTFYLTTGLSYAIDTYVLSIPKLQSEIGIWNSSTSSDIVQLLEDHDYIIQNGYIEFINDIFESVDNGQSLYCEQASIIETSLFSTYGSLVGIPDWTRYDYNNINGKAAVNTLLKSIQNSSNIIDYQKALNIYYGLPVAPQNCKVVGLYESYNYLITDIDGSDITLELNEDLHNFIQIGTKLLIDRTKEEVIVDSIVDRSAGIVTVDDITKVQINDTVNVRLQNKYHIKQITAETSSTEGNIQVYTDEYAEKIQHIIDVIQFITENSEYPEIMIYDSSNGTTNYDGTYHITSAINQSGNVIQLNVYNPVSEDEPRYNDFIFNDRNEDTDVDIGILHISWPTHKFLLLLLDDGSYFKAYIDAPLDTIYDEGDFLNKYDQICRNVSVANDTGFPDWNQFDGFRRYNGIDEQSSIVELIGVTPNVQFGKYFPSSVSNV